MSLSDEESQPLQRNEAPFRCNICEKSFFRKDNLETHLKIHRDPGTYSCRICGRSFMREEALRRHHHGGMKRTGGAGVDGVEPATKKAKKDFKIEKLDHKNMEKFGTTIDRYRVSFHEDDESREVGDIFARLESVFRNLLEIITGQGEDTDRIQVSIETVDLDFPITLPFRKRDEISGGEILDRIETVIQSNEQFRLDSSVTIRVTTVNMPKGGRKRLGFIDFEKRLKTSKSIIRIKNNDELCCARAIVTAKAKIDKHESWNYIRQGRILQQELALELHNTAGVPLKKCVIEEIKCFQEALPGYQINVISKEHFDTMIFQGPESEKKIYIYLHDNHYDVITKMAGFLNASYYCDKCRKGYADKVRHRCNNVCKCCLKFHKSSGSWVYCKSCNRYFMGEECYEKHRASTSKGISTCRRLFRCKDCHQIINRSDREKEDHHCGEIKCKTCYKYVEPDHLCYIQPIKKETIDEPNDSNSIDLELEYDLYNMEGFNENDNEEEVEEKQPQKYIFYDFEAMQDNGVHVPNLCVAQIVCELCIDDKNSKCDTCGTRERIFSGVDTTSSFGKWLFSKENNGAICICHNFKGYDSYFIMEYLHNNGVLPTVIMNGAKVMCVEVTQCEMKFIDSINFLPMALAKLPKTFGISELKKGYFPHFFNTAANQNVVLEHLPPVETYNPDGMKLEDREKFLQWYEIHRHDPFDLQRELLTYCRSDVDILRRSCTKFRNLFISLTDIDPFLHCITIASACNLTFRTNFLQPETIGIIPTHGYTPEHNQSVIALEWIKYTSHTMNVRIKHAKNGGEYRIGPYLVDGYYESDDGEKIVLEYQGCFWHGCLKCYSRDTINSVNNMTMEELHNRTIDKKRYIERLGYTVKEMWECEWKRVKEGDESIKHFIDGLDTSTPIKPRESFYGGRTETFKLYREAGENERIKYSDFTSLYPYVNKYCKYPIGHPVIITENFTELTDYEGLMKCTILPPRDFYLPVLPFRSSKKLLFPLCRKCAERQIKECEHSETERALTGVWVTDEIKLAVEKGYKILRIFEVWHFTKTTTFDPVTKNGGLFTEYIDTFLKVKQESTGWPPWCDTEDNKNDYLNNYFYNEGIYLDSSQIYSNPGLRALSKLMLNSFWGKFGQRVNLTQTEYISDPTRYYELLTSDSIIVHAMRYVNEHLAHVQWSHDDKFVEPGERTNVILASYTTAHARIKLYRLLDSLGERILYADTDSVIYTVREGEYDPPLGDYLGQLTDELDGDYITHFVSGGPKNYAYKTSRSDSNSEVTHCKVRGITLNYRNSMMINFDSVRDMVVGVGPEKITVVDENKIVRDQQRTKIVSKMQKKRITE